MRILFLSQLLPLPLDAGAKIRAYYVLKHLAAMGHAVTLCSFVRGTDTPGAVETLRGIVEDVVTVPLVRSRARDLLRGIRSVARSSSLTLDRDRVPAMRRRLLTLTQRAGPYDVVHADQLSMASDALEVRARGAARHVVLDQHNAVFRIVERLEASPSLRFLRWWLALEARKLASAERRICATCDRVVWVSGEDRRAVLGERPPRTHAAVIPIAVEPVRAVHGERAAVAAHVVAERDTEPPARVTFLGGLDWPPNREGVHRLVTRIWPRVSRRVSGAQLTIVGKHPPRWLLARARSDPELEVTGYVVDPAPILEGTRVFVVPLYAGAGMRVKILEAWRCGLPVVSTTLGAESLAAEHGTNLLLADDDDDFAAAVVSLLTDARRRACLGAGGRRTLAERYDWRTTYAAWNDVYEGLSSTGDTEG